MVKTITIVVFIVSRNIVVNWFVDLLGNNWGRCWLLYLLYLHWWLHYLLLCLHWLLYLYRLRLRGLCYNYLFWRLGYWILVLMEVLPLEGSLHLLRIDSLSVYPWGWHLLG